MINLIVFCGVPASGKTTESKKIAKQYNAVRYSLDEMKMYYLKDLIPYAMESLLQGDNVVMDSLYIRTFMRLDLLNAIKDIECKKTLIFMNTPLEECLQRNAKRENRLPYSLVEGAYKAIQIPSYDEGWDEIIYYNNI